MHAEISARASAIKSTCGMLSYSFLFSPVIRQDTKLRVLRATILAKGLYNSGTWPELNNGEMSRVRSAVCGAYANCLPRGESYETDPSYDSLLKDHAIPSPEATLRACRLRLCIRVVSRAPPEVLRQLSAVRGAKRSWLKAVELDFREICEAVPALFDCTNGHFHRALQFMRDHPRRFRKFVDSWTKDVSLHRQTHVPVKCHLAGAVFPCPSCEAQFGSRQALAVHSFMKHGAKVTIRSKVDSTVCAGCLIQFWTRSRVMEHLGKSHRCCNYVSGFPDVDASVVSCLELEEAQKARARSAKVERRHTVYSAAVRCSGPVTKHLYELGFSHSLGLRSGTCYPCAV